jgi:cyclopropane fatty-acyl-phospholipid synthase-like methyltransferase
MKMFKNKSNYKFVGSLDRVPLNVSYLADSANSELSSDKIDLKWNEEIQHIHIGDNISAKDGKYYDNYLMTTSYSDTIQELQKQQLERLMSIYEEKEGSLESLIEIGCGDGSFLKHAVNKIPKLTGIEPSARFSATAIEQGYKIINGYVNSSSKITEDLFDSFVSRQVFEHLSDPLDVLLGIKAMLNPGAVGLIEVPNGYKAMRKRRFYEFFPDHLNYYSVNSLVTLASEAGFNVISCQETFNGDYLELWLRNDTEDLFKKRLNDLIIEREKVCTNLFEKIKSLSSKKKIMIFGCGAKTLSIFSGFTENISGYIDGVIDSDPNKRDLYIPNTSIQVFSLSQSLKRKPDVVIILALSYLGEIKNIVKKNLPEVILLSLDKNNKIIEL